MTTELRITFSGLCLFVPDGSKMHVLMPRTEGHGGHGGRWPGQVCREFERSAPISSDSRTGLVRTGGDAGHE